MKKVLSIAFFITSMIGFLCCIFVLINNGKVLMQIPLPEGPTAQFLAFRISSGLTFSILVLSSLFLLLAIVLKKRAHN